MRNDNPEITDLDVPTNAKYASFPITDMGYRADLNRLYVVYEDETEDEDLPGGWDQLIFTGVEHDGDRVVLFPDAAPAGLLPPADAATHDTPGGEEARELYAAMEAAGVHIPGHSFLPDDGEPSVMTPSKRDRAVGALLGLACGDALGRPVEFMHASSIEREHGTVTEMLGHGTHSQPAGTITDDTDLALCIARSLVEQGGFDGPDIAQRFIDWYEAGPFDIGRMTASAIRRLQRGESWKQAGHSEWEVSEEGRNAGNGSLMRTAPHGIAFAGHTDKLIQYSFQSSGITHADPRCKASCAIFNLILANFIDGETGLSTAVETYHEAAHERLLAYPDEVAEAVESVRNGSIKEADLLGSGYVVDTFQTALYHAHTADSAEGAIVNAVNMGGDTDTVGAVTGALAGARFGASALPDRWLSAIDETGELTELAEKLSTLES